MLISGYASPLYEAALGGWQRTEMLGRKQSQKKGGEKSYGNTEIVWRNAAASEGSGDEMRTLYNDDGCAA